MEEKYMKRAYGRSTVSQKKNYMPIEQHNDTKFSLSRCRNKALTFATYSPALFIMCYSKWKKKNETKPVFMSHHFHIFHTLSQLLFSRNKIFNSRSLWLFSLQSSIFRVNPPHTTTAVLYMSKIINMCW